MKKIVLIFFSLSLATFICQGMTLGTVETDVYFPERIERSPAMFASDMQNYTTGGLTFNYPASFFGSTPFIFVSPLQNRLSYCQQ